MNYQCFAPNCSIIISGPSRSGKTTFTKQLILSGLIECDVILWYYSAYQDSYKDLIGRVVFCEGTPNIAELKQDTRRKLLVLDDLMMQMDKDDLTTLYSVMSHHCQMSVIFITQNAFYQGIRTARINSSYLVLMKSPGDKLSIVNLAKQLHPSNSKFLIDAYTDACRKPHGYLLVDLDPNTDDQLRLRTQIFEVCPVVYINTMRK